MEESRCSSLVNDFWQTHVTLIANEYADKELENSPVLAQAAAILVLANVLKDRQEGK